MNNNEKLNRLTALLKHTRPRLATTHRLKFKNCFGAVAGYVHGKIFISCGAFGIALKLPAKTLAVLFKKKDVKHLKYFPNGHIKKEYAVLPERIMQDRRALKKFVDESISYVLSLR